jgi:hypothetical protein
MTVEDWIKASLRKLAVYPSGESPTPEELKDGLMAAQSMLRSWAALGILAFASTNEDFALVSGTQSYTWGVGGTFNSARPNSILNATLDTTKPISVFAYGDKYSLVTEESGQPTMLFYNPAYPFATVLFDKNPDSGYILNIESLKPFTETSSFDSLTSTVQFPSVYEEAFIYNLSLRLAPEFGKPVPLSVSIIADQSYKILISLNAASKVETVRFGLPTETLNN